MTPRFSDDAFVREFGSYLCSVRHGLTPVGERPGTCKTCATPLKDDHPECYQCHHVHKEAMSQRIPFPVDELAFLTYAVEAQSGNSLGDTHEREGRQAYRVLKGYKVSTPLPVHWRAMTAWIVWSLQRWWPQGDESVPWCWATVPSRRSDRVGEHPLHRIARAVLPQTPEVEVTYTGSSTARGFDSTAYSAASVPSNNQVLLIEDSWAMGGNVFSAAAALKKAGARSVSALMLGRLLNPSAWGPSRQFIEHGGLRAGFDPGHSPWVRTGLRQLPL